VHQITVHTVGAVIKAGEAIMQIVPTDLLAIEVKILPQDIDSVSLEQIAVLRLSAFDTRTTPVEAFIQTGERTVISYLIKPLVDQVKHTFREQ
jgi:HlyD family secretion protein